MAVEPALYTPTTVQPIEGEKSQLVAHVLDSVVRVAQRLQDVRAVALVGSRARGAQRPDSDVDLVIIVRNKSSFMNGESWRAFVPADCTLVRSREWGALTERRARFATGLEVELGFVQTDWARTDPIDEGTRRVVSDGIRVLYDPDALLPQLIAAVTDRAR